MIDVADRYVLLGLARAQSRWFADVARWAHSGAMPAEFVKVLSVEELRARLRSGRFFSALLVDATLPGCDPDLVHLAHQHGCRTIVVDDRAEGRDWSRAGVAAVLASDFERTELLRALRTVATPVAQTAASPPQTWSPSPAAETWRGRLVSVTGAGGVGRSTVAAALASGLAADPRESGLVVLADLALCAQQGLLHDAGDVVPGLSELVEAHRHGAVPENEVRGVCFAVPERAYDVLLGLRRQRDWASLRRRSLAAALDGLRRTYRVVVADVDSDVEGEGDCGSVEVEERNMLARTTLDGSDLVVVVASPGVTGLHAHVRVLHDLIRFGLAPERLVSIVNRAPRNPRTRAEITRAVADLLELATGKRCPIAAPVFVPERRRQDDMHRDGSGRLPAPVVAAVTTPVRALLDQLPSLGRDAGDRELVSVSPGTLGSWSPSSEEALP